MAKTSKDRDRAERVEAMRRESVRAERRRTLIVVAICGVVALAIVGATGWKLYSDSQRADEVAGTDLAAIGASASAAGCADITTSGAEGQGQHLDGQQIDYPDAPPAYGPHWGEDPAEFTRKLYTEDRPELEQLVHSLEHGYTILWYDETVADDGELMQAVEDLAVKFDVGNIEVTSEADLEQRNANKFIAAPWTGEDGDAFPDAAHVALSHWALEGEDAVEKAGMGVWQYCDAPSGEALASFMAEYPSTNSPEPDGL